jgi:signal transduction histidine kinase
MKLLSSLTNRIFIASAALTVLCMGIAILLVNVRVTASAEEELRRGLRQSGALLDQQRASTSDLFAVMAHLVADLPRLKAAVATDDPPTVQPVAAEYQDQLGSDLFLFLVTGRSGRTLASVGRAGGAPLQVPPTVSSAVAGKAAATFAFTPAGVLQVVSVPITAGAEPPEIIGTLSVGFLLDAALAERLKALTGSEIAFVAGTHVVASTLPRESWDALVPLIGQSTISRVSVGGNEYEALLRPLAPPDATSSSSGAPAAGGRVLDQANAVHPAAIILQSRTERLRFLRPIQTALVLIGLTAVLLATVISYGIARTITRPLDAITATMHEITATGDLTRKIAWPAQRWNDEDARVLARTFDTLTESVARFQAQAAERERLSALGRLSTVIAHEIRNPLMIIRGALRPLQRDEFSTADVRDATADIDGEVTRLNRLVNEVLDFARPVRFDLAPADINHLCEESAVAAQADRAGPPVRLVLDPSQPQLVTDAERLRSVLVNILVNARHAVESRESAPRAASDAAPPVELSTVATRGGGCTIVVRDRGEGIAAEDLPRVFEPYFTTKRTGTGLGLAISRNIIEGLGGTIAASSEVGTGTEIRIVLPPAARRHETGAS